MACGQSWLSPHGISGFAAQAAPDIVRNIAAGL
jgi:hypothetical protein